MIKNLLYSLFLHFLLLLLVYANFNLKNVNENKSSEISLSLIALSGTEDSKKNKISADDAELKKTDETPKAESAQEPKSVQQSKKNKVRAEPKKMAKSKPSKSVAKPVITDSAPSFKEVEKVEEKQQDTTKSKEEKVINENTDDEKSAETKKEKDLGSEKKFEQEQESDKKKNTSDDEEQDSANNLENLDLSVREKFNIHSQLKRCYSRAVLESGTSGKSKILIKVTINQDGVMDSDIDDTIDIDRYNDPKDSGYKIAVDNSRRAIDLCSPLRNLPVDKYDVWKEVVLEFGDIL